MDARLKSTQESYIVLLASLGCSDPAIDNIVYTDIERTALEEFFDKMLVMLDEPDVLWSATSRRGRSLAFIQKTLTLVCYATDNGEGISSLEEQATHKYTQDPEEGFKSFCSDISEMIRNYMP